MNSATADLERSRNTESFSQFTSYRKLLLNEAESIVLDKFPRKVVEFNTLLNSKKFWINRLPEFMPSFNEVLPLPMQDDVGHETSSWGSPDAKRWKSDVEKMESPGTPVWLFNGGETLDELSYELSHCRFGEEQEYQNVQQDVPCNLKLAELMDLLRPLLAEAAEDVNKVKVWIRFLIPRIEDGNNFGVSIQEECLSEVRTVESEVASFSDEMSRYFTSRARIITKIAKYPYVEDYRRAFSDMDEKQFLNIRLVIMEMRNRFAYLHDLLTKNIENIKRPRSNIHENMC